MKEIGASDSNGFNGKRPKIKLADPLQSFYSDIVEILSSGNHTKLLAKVNGVELSDLSDNKLKLDYFLKIREELRKSYTQLNKHEEGFEKRIPDFSDPVVKLDSIVSEAIKYFKGIEADIDVDVPKWGIRVGDITHLLKTV